MKRILAGLAAAWLLLAPGLVAAQTVALAPLVDNRVNGGTATQTLPAGKTLLLRAPTAANASINMPPGTAPSSPNNGDCWTTSAGLYCQIAGSTVGPMAPSGGLSAIADQTLLANISGGSAVPTATAFSSVTGVGSALKWTTARTLTLGSDLTGSASFDGSAGFTLNATIGAHKVVLGDLAQIAANTMLGNWTGSTADVAANAMTSCPDTGGNHLNYVSGTGITCGTSGGGGLSDGDKGDVTVSGSGTTWTMDNDTVTYAKMQNVSAASRILGRKTASAGDAEEMTLSEALDFVGSATKGDILVRDTSSWVRLAAGTSGYVLKANGAGALPSYAPVSGGGGVFSTPSLLIVQKTTNQGTANGTWTTISWDTTAVQDDLGAFSSGAPTQITVPSGITKMRALVYGVWVSNSSGLRGIRLTKGGTPMHYKFWNANLDSPDQMQTRWLTVAAGNVFTVDVIQASGGFLSFAGGAAGSGLESYVQVEWAP